MNEDAIDTTIDEPTTALVKTMRSKAERRRDEVKAELPTEEPRFLVVSPRGTCVVVGEDTRQDTFPPSEDAETIADELPGS
jgi:hypothetical protein